MTSTPMNRGNGSESDPFRVSIPAGTWSSYRNSQETLVYDYDTGSITSWGPKENRTIATLYGSPPPWGKKTEAELMAETMGRHRPSHDTWEGVRTEREMKEEAGFWPDGHTGFIYSVIALIHGRRRRVLP